MLEAYLWSSQDQGLSIVTVHLSSQEMEVVGRHGHLGELEIDVLPCQVVVRACEVIIGLGIYVLEEPLDVAC